MMYKVVGVALLYATAVLLVNIIKVMHPTTTRLLLTVNTRLAAMKI